jgi:TonB family protein
MNLLHILGLFWALGSAVFVDPAYPPNAVTGGTVIAELHSVSGRVERLTVQSGSEPFLSSAKAALAKWSLHPETDGDDLVIVHFRQPNIYYLDNAGEEVHGTRSAGHLPYPKTIVGPAYPANMLGQGSVILRIEISSSGNVASLQAERGAGSLADVSIDAVRKWKFLPAKDDRGMAISSSAYAVLVYRFPVIDQKK